MIIKMLVFFAVSSWAAWMILFMGLQTKRELRLRGETEHTRATGTIVDYVRKGHPGRHSRVYWVPVVEFTADGRRIHAEYENPMDQSKFPVGTYVDILYDVSDPTHFHLEMDPIFSEPGAGAIRIGILSILACAALTLILAVFVGGLRIDLGEFRHWIRMLFFRLKR